jgi:lipopolysaccharide transport system ATP-binding protein
MSSDEIAIKVENLSKIYRIGIKDQVHDSFARTILDFVRSPLKNYKKYRSLYNFKDILSENINNSNNDVPNIIWALKDVSFELKKGEALGIIGRNGAGKSTLLKMLSKITSPTSGWLKIIGRSSSLLEVGTGFHPELTGRENVYLNGTILGMRKKEIDKKFDEIVEFSGVRKFIDTPVKRFSSGMNVRLAFAVAAHLEPEILIVDEVLAVGDAEFQMKCLGKMNSVARGGKTVILVSHNMGAISELCSRVLWLDEGRLKMDGPSADVVSEYMHSDLQGTGYWVGRQPEEHLKRYAWLRQGRVLSGNNDKVSSIVHYDEPVKIEVEYEIKNSVSVFMVYLLLRDSVGNILMGSHDTDGTDKIYQNRKPGIYKSVCVFPKRLFRPGHYFVSIGIKGQPREAIEEEHLDALSFNISETGYAFNHDPRKGLIAPYLKWDIINEKDGNRSKIA